MGFKKSTVATPRRLTSPEVVSVQGSHMGVTKRKDRPGTENMHARQLWMVLSVWISPRQFLRDVRPNGDPLACTGTLGGYSC